MSETVVQDLQVLKVETETIQYLVLLLLQAAEAAQEEKALTVEDQVDLVAEVAIQAVVPEVVILHQLVLHKDPMVDQEAVSAEAEAAEQQEAVILALEPTVDLAELEVLQILQTHQQVDLVVAAGELMDQQVALQVMVEDQEVLLHQHQEVKDQLTVAVAAVVAEEPLEDHKAEAVVLE